MTGSDAPATTRRSVLRRGAVAVGGGVLVGQVDAQESETPTGTGPGGARALQRMIIPRVEAFEGNYEGQYVFVQTDAGESPNDLPSRECDFRTTWPPDRTQRFDGQLLDRISEQPTTAEVPIFTDGRVQQIDDHTHFIVQRVVTCPGDYVGLYAERIPRGVKVGGPPGPTVEPTETGGPGFGALAAAVGTLGAAAYHALRSGEGES